MVQDPSATPGRKIGAEKLRAISGHSLFIRTEEVFLKITTKFIYNISKSLSNQMKTTTPLIILKKKILTKKIVQKSIHTGSEAVTLILALIAISKAYRQKIEKIRPLLKYNRGYIT